MNFRWLMRAAIWTRRPPSARKVKLVVGLIAVCLCIAFIEYYVGWPDWATMERAPRIPRF